MNWAGNTTRGHDCGHGVETDRWQPCWAPVRPDPHDLEASDPWSDAAHQQGPLAELASGIDALDLSGRAVLPAEFLARLEDQRQVAEGTSIPNPFDLGGEDFGLAPHGWGAYRFCLEHPDVRVGVSTSKQRPAIRVSRGAGISTPSAPPALSSQSDGHWAPKSRCQAPQPAIPFGAAGGPAGVPMVRLTIRRADAEAFRRKVEADEWPAW